MQKQFLFNIPKWWSYAQRSRLAQLRQEGAWIGFWNSNEDCQPANSTGYLADKTYTGAIHYSEGPLRDTCGLGQLHATRRLLCWKGKRIWVVALKGKTYGNDIKSWSLCREIIGEIYHTDNVDDASLKAYIELNEGLPMNLSDQNMTAMSASGKIFVDTNFFRSNFENSDLRYTDFSNVIFEQTNLVDSLLNYARLCNVKLLDSNLNRSLFEYVKFKDVLFDGNCFQGVSLKKCEF